MEGDASRPLSPSQDPRPRGTGRNFARVIVLHYYYNITFIRFDPLRLAYITRNFDSLTACKTFVPRYFVRCFPL